MTDKYTYFYGKIKVIAKIFIYLSDYNFNKMSVAPNSLQTNLKEISLKNRTKDVVKHCVTLLDVTTLDVKDTPKSVSDFTANVLRKLATAGLPPVASICVNPRFIGDAGVALADTSISITSVVGAFPLAQTFVEVKMLECAMALENGADELDIVLNVGGVMEGDFDLVLSELILLKEEIAGDAVMKVIIESGELQQIDLIKRATAIAIAAGADFVKTSTGKVPVNATREAVIAMCEVIKEHFEQTGNRVGIKVAGGVSSVEDMVEYYTIVEEILGEQWLAPQYFRFGTSSLLDKIIEFVK